VKKKITDQFNRLDSTEQVYINLAGHGHSELGIQFSDGSPEHTSVFLYPDDILDILADNRLKGRDIIFATQACQGAGLHTALEKKIASDPNYLNDRKITIITAAKDTESNQEARVDLTWKVNPNGFLPEKPTIFSTYYNIFFHKALLDKKTIGEAHLIADRESKKYVPGMNPEIITLVQWNTFTTRSVATKGVSASARLSGMLHE
jgi:hypothetical protein